MLDTLNEFDRRVAKAVVKAFPDWSVFATVEESGGGHTLFIIQAPSGNETEPLIIKTWGSEVIVAFGHCHTHFDDFSDGTAHDALTFVRKIISGKCAAVSYWQDQLWIGSLLVDDGNLPKGNDIFPRANQIRIRSWTGALDDDITCIPRE